MKRITAFRDEYARFQSARSDGRAEEAWQAQQQMALLAPPVQHDLERVNCGSMILYDAPALGGTRYHATITGLALHSDTADRYKVRPQDMILTMTQALGEYARQANGEIAPEQRDYPSFHRLGLVSAIGRFLWRPKAFVGGLVAFITMLAGLSQLGWYEPLRLWLSGFGIHLPPSGAR